MSMLQRDALAKRLDELPLLPRVVAQIMSLAPDSASFFDEIVAIIETEPNYALRLLAAANSAVVRGVVPINRIRDAVVRLGTRQVSNLVVSMSVARVFVPRSDWERGLWVHALEVASVARALARHHGDGMDCERAYLSGLLHDVGRFIMFDAAPDALREVDEAHWDTPAEMIAAERAICGLDHAELGARVCERWSIPGDFVEVVKNHHAPLVEERLGAAGRIVRLVQVADNAGFSALSSRHDVPVVRTMKPEQADVYVRGLLPAWYAKPEGIVQVVHDALAHADIIAEQIGLKRKGAPPHHS